MIWIFISCSQPQIDSAIEQEEVPLQPTYTIEEYKDAIQNTLTHGIPNAEDARKIYLEWMQHGDNNCPGSSYLLQGIIEPCTANSGYIYSGLVAFMGATNELSFPDFYEVGADSYILSPTGDRFVGAGELFYQSDGDVSIGRLESRIRGTWQAQNQDGWIAQDNSIWLRQDITWNQQGWDITLNGAYHLNDVSLRFHNLLVSSGCTNGIGTIEVRDPTGYWLNIALEQNCSGCGTAEYEGQQLGTVCLDLYDSLNQQYESLRVGQ